MSVRSKFSGGLLAGLVFILGFLLITGKVDTWIELRHAKDCAECEDEEMRILRLACEEAFANTGRRELCITGDGVKPPAPQSFWNRILTNIMDRTVPPVLRRNKVELDESGKLE